MKEYIINAVLYGIFFSVMIMLFDYLFGDGLQTCRYYIIASVFYGILMSLAHYLDDRGWNSWSRILGLFKNKCKK